MAACLICSGVSKSGSPAAKPITSAPAALSALTLAVSASVAEDLRFVIRCASRLELSMTCITRQ